MKEIEQLKKRVEELEAEVAKLKIMQPAHVIHSHYHYTQPVLFQQMGWVPSYPQVTWGAGGQGTAG